MKIDKSFPIGIVGAGVLGGAMVRTFSEWSTVRVHDRDPKRSLHTMKEVATSSELVFICVPTPLLDSGKGLDILGVLEVAMDIASYNTKAKIVIRSTMPVGGTREILRRLNKIYSDQEIQVAYSPEFLTARCSEVDMAFPVHHLIGNNTKIGMTCPVVSTLSRLYMYRYGVDPVVELLETIETVKLATNAYFATKVCFFNELHMAIGSQKQFDIVRSIMGADPRIGMQHTAVPGTDGLPGFGGTCLPKDTVEFSKFCHESKYFSDRAWLVDGTNCLNVLHRNRELL